MIFRNLFCTLSILACFVSNYHINVICGKAYFPLLQDFFSQAMKSPALSFLISEVQWMYSRGPCNCRAGRDWWTEDPCDWNLFTMEFPPPNVSVEAWFHELMSDEGHEKQAECGDCKDINPRDCDFDMSSRVR